MMSYDDFVSRILGELDGALRSVHSAELDVLRQHILSAAHTYVAGKGRSGLHMRGFAMRLMHLGLGVYVVDEVTTPAIGANDLLIIGSGSGRTASLVQYAQRAKALNARLALITASDDSPIGSLADSVVHIRAPSPKTDQPDTHASFQPMANLFEQSLGLLLDVLTIQLMAELNLTSEQMFTRHANLE